MVHHLTGFGWRFWPGLGAFFVRAWSRHRYLISLMVRLVNERLNAPMREQVATSTN